MDNQIIFMQEICTNCGLCGKVCPNKIIKRENGSMSLIEDRISLCFKCGQCMSVCPSMAISIEGLSYERDFCDTSKADQNENSFFNLISSRRAVRNFKDMPVPRVMLEKIIDSLSFAPVGFPPVNTEVIIVQNPEDIKRALPYMVDLYDFLYKAFNNPVKKFFIKKEVGKSKFGQMENHLIPLLRVRLPGLKNGTEDTITRNAPAMILFHADKNGQDTKADVYIAAAYCMLAAHAMGLGGSIMDIIPPAINKKKELREMFCIPEGHDVITSLIIGFPKYRYCRGIIKRLKSIRWV